MAQLKANPYPMPDFGSFDNYDAYHQAQQDAMNDIDDPLLRFPIADGYAFYRVVEMEYTEPCECCDRGGEPLLQHVPYGDGYKARGETIKGLTTADARKQVDG